MNTKIILYCCGCDIEVTARLTDGSEVYPHRPDLYKKNFWKCDICKNFVGTHNDGSVKPLGVIATQEIKRLRMDIHRIIDPIWKSKRARRGSVYKKLSTLLGYSYHTANIRSVREAEIVLSYAYKIQEEYQ